MPDRSYQLAIEIAAKDLAGKIFEQLGKSARGMGGDFGQAASDVKKHGGGIIGTLKDIAKHAAAFAGGQMIVNGIRSLGQAAAGTVREAWAASASYERMKMSMTSLAKTEIMAQGEIAKTIDLGKKRYELTQADIKQLEAWRAKQVATWASTLARTPGGGATSDYSWSGRTLTVTFAHSGGPGIAAGDGYSIRVNLSVPTGLSPDWDYNGVPVTNTASVSADNAATVEASVDATVTIQ